jgi:hypothetical protein
MIEKTEQGVCKIFVKKQGKLAQEHVICLKWLPERVP